MSVQNLTIWKTETIHNNVMREWSKENYVEFLLEINI